MTPKSEHMELLVKLLQTCEHEQNSSNVIATVLVYCTCQKLKIVLLDLFETDFNHTNCVRLVGPN